MLDRITLWMKNIAEENMGNTAISKAAKMQRSIDIPEPSVISTKRENLALRAAWLTAGSPSARLRADFPLGRMTSGNLWKKYRRIKHEETIAK
jgi:hypothetical protein